MANVKDPSNFLCDTGLLFEINRRILHPMGLALAIQFPDEGELDPTLETATVSILDARDDPEGYVFEDDTMAEGQAKLEKFVAENALQQKLMIRRAQLGFITQTIPPEAEPEPPFSIKR
jgi:hypothetical protein